MICDSIQQRARISRHVYISCEGSNDDGLTKERYVVAGSLAIGLTSDSWLTLNIGEIT